MEYDFVYIERRTYLHVIGSGTHSIDNINRFFADTNRVRTEKQFDSVLIEMRFVGPSLHFGGIYSIIVDNLRDASLVKRIAYVDTVAEHLVDRTEFAALAGRKLGLRGGVFRTVDEAQAWLGE